MHHAAPVHSGGHVPQRGTLRARWREASLRVRAQLPRRALRDTLRPVRRGGRAAVRRSRHLLPHARIARARQRATMRLRAVLDGAALRCARPERSALRRRRRSGSRQPEPVSERRHVLHREPLGERRAALPLPPAVRWPALSVQRDTARSHISAHIARFQ